MVNRRSVPQRELRNSYSKLLREVEQGAELTITAEGRPVARLVPASRRRRLVPAADLERILGGEPIDADAFLRDVRPPGGERVHDRLQ